MGFRMGNELLVLVGIKFCAVIAIAAALAWLARRYPRLVGNRGWYVMLAGLLVLASGDLATLVMWEVVPAVVRYGLSAGGEALVAVGLWAWLPMALSVQQTEIDLKRINERLEREVEARTRELRLANAKLRRDLDERRQVEHNIRHLAHHDALTGLPNRALFRDRLTHAMAQADRYRQILAVMFLDLDRFKAINDTLGHDVGDQLLRIAAERLRTCVRDCDTVARLGGDEFTVIVEDLGSVQDAAVVAQKIIDGLAQPFHLLGHEVFITASIGITIYPTDGENVETLLRNADSAMYRAKEHGRNNFQFYVADMNTRARERLMLESALRRALEREEFTLYYQPRVDLFSGKVIGAEALLRWRHPEMGQVPPAEFIPILEETGLIIPVGEWVLHTACAQARAWQDAALGPVRVAVNLSVRQFLQRDLVDRVRRALERVNLDAGALELEITEDLLLEQNQANLVALEGLKALGVHIAIDDFGTGYSSLSYLKRLPIDTLKIDQSFIRDIERDADGKAIASAIIAMATSLRLTVIAEGVETEQQLGFLRAHGCDEIQGFSFSQPLTAAEFESLLREGRQMRVLQGLAGYYVNVAGGAGAPLTH